MGQVLIDHIQVTLEPWRYGHTQHIELRIRIKTMGQEFNRVEVVRPDDIESNLDRYFDAAKHGLLDALKKQATESAVTP